MPSHRVTRFVQAGAAAWCLLLIFFVAQALAQAAFTPAYSLLDDRISDLGNTTCGPWLTHAYACSPLHALVDVSFVVTGLLLIAGAVLTWPAWPPRKLSAAGLLCVVLAGLGYVLVGLNPEDLNMRLHILGASNLIFSNLALLFLGLATRQERSWRSKLALGLACVGFGGLLIGPVLLAGVGHAGGLAERLVLYPLVVFAMTVGGACLKDGSRAAYPRAELLSTGHRATGT
jgi:hypothetical membrane protein